VSSGALVRRLKRLSGRLLLAMVPLLLAFAACELLLRLAGPAPAEPVPARPERALTCDHDSLLGWIFPPGASGDYPDDHSPIIIETNAWGLRGPDCDTDPDVFHVVVLGDSYAFGWGVAETASFPRRLESLLRARTGGRPLAVINAGVPGYGPYQQLAMLRYVARHVRPDVVISTFSLANDPVDELRMARYAPDRLLDYVPAVRDPGSFVSRLSRVSRTIALVDGRTRGLQMFLTNAGGEARAAAEASLTRLIGACDEIGAPLLLVVVPQRNRILRGGPAGWVSDRITGRLRALPGEIANRHGVPLVDLTPALEHVHRDGKAFLPRDAHWSADGHASVARAVSEALPASWLGGADPSRAGEIEPD